MKKIIISLAIILGGFVAVSAQYSGDKLTNKNGLAILPEAGDIALGIEANPFLGYIGNLFNSSTQNTNPSFSGLSDQTIYVKYFLSDLSALRLKLGFDFGTDRKSQAVSIDDANSLNNLNSVIDYRFNRSRELSLSVGYEMRRGYNRLQGFYGAELGLGFTNNFTTYQYGNEMTAMNQAPTTASFTGNENSIANRTLERYDGKTFNAGLNAFVGVEYFFAPKMSVGGELGLGFYANTGSMGYVKSEQFNGSANQIEELSTRIGSTAENNMHFTTLPTGRLFLAFYF